MTQAQPPAAPSASFAIVVGNKKLGPCGLCAFFNPYATRQAHKTGRCYFLPPAPTGRPLLAESDPGCASFKPAAGAS